MSSAPPDGDSGLPTDEGGRCESSSTAEATKFPWLNLSGFERFAISSRIGQAKARYYQSGSLILSQERDSVVDINQGGSEESVGDLPIELRHLEEEFGDLLPLAVEAVVEVESDEPMLKDVCMGPEGVDKFEPTRIKDSLN